MVSLMGCYDADHLLMEHLHYGIAINLNVVQTGCIVCIQNHLLNHVQHSFKHKHSCKLVCELQKLKCTVLFSCRFIIVRSLRVCNACVHISKQSVSTSFVFLKQLSLINYLLLIISSCAVSIICQTQCLNLILKTVSEKS